jgi:serine/alanine adding enzyme
MPRVKILSADHWTRWDQFVLSHKGGTIYHTSSWCRVIEQTYGHQPVYVIIEDDSGAIQAGLPLFYIKSKLAGYRLVGLPGAQACDPLVSNQEEYDQLVAFALDFMQRHHIKNLELRTSEHFQLDSRKFGHEMKEYSCYILNLDRELQAIESSLKKDSIRRRIKKAYASGLQLSIGESLNDIKEFYKLYLQLRKNRGLLPQPYLFFSSMFANMAEDKNIDILHAKYGNRVVSSLILLKYKDAVNYEFGASRPDMMHLGTSPFLLWEAIKKAKRDGYKRFDFGRTSDDNTSLAQFKLKWGTTCEALPYYFIPGLGNTAIIRRKSLSKVMMSYAIHYSPPRLCQLMGRTLYKHFV